MFTRTHPVRHFHFTDVLQTLSQILQCGMDNCFVQPDATTTQLVPAHNRIEESEVEGTPLPPFFRMTSKPRLFQQLPTPNNRLLKQLPTPNNRLKQYAHKAYREEQVSRTASGPSPASIP